MHLNDTGVVPELYELFANFKLNGHDFEMFQVLYTTEMVFFSRVY